MSGQNQDVPVEHDSGEDELNYWKKRCLDTGTGIEAKVEKHISQSIKETQQNEDAPAC